MSAILSSWWFWLIPIGLVTLVYGGFPLLILP